VWVCYENCHNGSNLNRYLNEIKNNVGFPKLYLAIRNKLNRDTVYNDEINALLLGQKVNDFSIDPKKLYGIYFTFSDQFAKKEFENLKLYYDCDISTVKEIDDLAKERNISLETGTCQSDDKEDENSMIYILVTGSIATFIFFIFFLRKRKINA
jgi:hypothetical protein